MNRGRIEQLGAPSELYEAPSTAFVAAFLGVSNLIPGTVTGPETVRLRGGGDVRVPREALRQRSGEVAVGIRPEKIELGGAHENRLEGSIFETAYVGVATQYIVETDCGRLTVYVQNARPRSAPAENGRVTLSWNPEATFVVDSVEGTE
jgi:spermidine/putrescine transport system ATP-binding protein